MEYTLKQAVSIAIKCAREYKRKFANTRVLIIYRNRENNMIESIEIVFRPSNFQHLTGLLLKDKSGNVTNITKIVGDYDKSKKWMEADMIVGGINFCLAVSENTEDREHTYFPRSGLLEDIRNITRNPSQVLAIFKKKLMIMKNIEGYVMWQKV